MLSMLQVHKAIIFETIFIYIDYVHGKLNKIKLESKKIRMITYEKRKEESKSKQKKWKKNKIANFSQTSFNFHNFSLIY
jgi:hypothetical protein